NTFGDAADVHIAAGGQKATAQAWVESMGWDYVPAHSKQDVLDNVDRMVGASDRPVLMEVFTTMNDDSEGVRLIREANTLESLQRKITKRMPPEVKRMAKMVLGR